MKILVIIPRTTTKKITFLKIVEETRGNQNDTLKYIHLMQNKALTGTQAQKRHKTCKTKDEVAQGNTNWSVITSD